MGAYEKRIRHNGKIYCWNLETEQIEEITPKRVDVSECPDTVVFELLRLLGREACSKGGGAKVPPGGG
jgi:hypothetical protein